MNRIALLSLIALIALFAGACGTAASAVNAPAPAGSNAASGAVTTPASGGTQVNVTLADFTISSSLTTFKAGVPYTFVIKNTGSHAHNFNIAQPVAVSGSLDASLASALVVVTQQNLPIGGGTTVQYTFPASAVGTPLEMSCLIPKHYEAGMRLAVTVTQ